MIYDQLPLWIFRALQFTAFLFSLPVHVVLLWLISLEWLGQIVWVLWGRFGFVDLKQIEPLNRRERVLLRAEGSGNQAVITIALFCDDMSLPSLRGVVIKDWLRKGTSETPAHPRLQSLLRRVCGRWVFQRCTRFDLKDHVRSVSLDEFWRTLIINGGALFETKNQPIRLDDVMAFVNATINRPLSVDKPLWEILLLPISEDLHGNPGRCVVWRVHHALSDGLGLVHMMSNELLTDERTFVVPTLPRRPLLTRLAIYASLLYRTPLFIFANFLRLPPVPKWEELSSGKNRGPLLKRRMVSKPICLSLDDVKSVRETEYRSRRADKIRSAAETLDSVKTNQCTINDVFTSVTVGAIVRYIKANNISKTKGNLSQLKGSWNQIALTFPLNLRTEQPMTFSNDYGDSVLSLPLHFDVDALERFSRIAESLRSFRASGLLFGLCLFLRYVSHMPSVISECIVAPNRPKLASLISNVPGPQIIDRIGKSIRVRDCFFVPPLLGDVAVGVSGFSYNGQLWICTGADIGALDSPQLLNQCIQDEFEELRTRCKAV